MIIGVILNNFKCFKGLHYIPLTNADGTNFTGLIGLNGVGKSTVLEALDCVFNGKKLSPTIGQDIMPFKMTRIIPIFVIDGKEFQMISKLVSYQSNDKFKIISDALKDFINKEIPEDVSDTYKDVLNDMQKHWKKISISDKYLLPLYLSHGLFGVILGESQHAIILNDDYSAFSRNYINSHIYVHLSQNITEEYSFFETEQILRLLDIDLFKFLKEKFADLMDWDIDYQAQLRNISKQLSGQLNRYNITSLTENFDLNKKDLYDYICHKLPKYQLEKRVGNINVPISQLSSGEKKQALMDLIYSIVTNESKNNLVIAVDEPESSFHISERFEQFNKLYEISKNCGQVLFTSHWYGFIPAIPDGCVVNVVRNGNNFTFNPIDIYKYKEEISRTKYPIDIMLKGNSDLIQTLLSSVLIDDCYNWILCEGTSDKIYLEEYFKEEVENQKLRIVPVGGCANIKKIYNHLALSLLDLKNNIKGKIFLLVDTDENIKYEKPELPKEIKALDSKLRFNRLVNINSGKKTELVDFGSLQNTPTDIEGVLNGKAFNITLNKFKDEVSFVTDSEKAEIASAFALNLRDDEKDDLKKFFTSTNKVRFARAYVEEIQKGGYKVPVWIEEIKKFFKKP